MIKTDLAIISGIAITGICTALYLYKKKLDRTTIFSFSLDNEGKKIDKIEIYRNSKNEKYDDYLLECVKEDAEKLEFNDSNILFTKETIYTYICEQNYANYNTMKKKVSLNKKLLSKKSTYNGELNNSINHDVNVIGDTIYDTDKSNNEIVYIKEEIKIIPKGKYLISFDTKEKHFTCIGYNRNILGFYLMI